MHVILHHIQFVHLTILPLAESPDTFYDIPSHSSFEYPKSILGTPDYVVTALLDHVRLLFPFRHIPILFAFSLTA